MRTATVDLVAVMVHLSVTPAAFNNPAAYTIPSRSEEVLRRLQIEQLPAEQQWLLKVVERSVELFDEPLMVHSALADWLVGDCPELMLSSREIGQLQAVAAEYGISIPKRV